jgi:DNA-binding MarR family transcriptional regulator
MFYSVAVIASLGTLTCTAPNAVRCKCRLRSTRQRSWQTRSAPREVCKILDKVKYFEYHQDMIRDQEFIEKIRGFNRFYTNVIGLLDQHFLDTPFSLTEGRVLYEISHMEECSAKKIREHIAIDEGYLSRIIDKFIHKGLITKTPSPTDRRLHLIVLTKKGRDEFSKLNENSNRLISQITEKLSNQENMELVEMMESIQKLLTKSNRDEMR